MKIFFSICYILDLAYLLFLNFTNGDIRDMIVYATFCIVFFMLANKDN